MSKIGFDSEKYLAEQSRFILERVNSFSKLYLEFGGKLMNDTHAKRVLPGYDENCKLRLLQKLKDSGILFEKKEDEGHIIVRMNRSDSELAHSVIGLSPSGNNRKM